MDMVLSVCVDEEKIYLLNRTKAFECLAGCQRYAACNDCRQPPEYGKLSQSRAGRAKGDRQHDGAGITDGGAYANRFRAPTCRRIVMQ
jgi:hypothetical protein